MASTPEAADEKCGHELIEIWADATRERGGERTSMRGRCIACGAGLTRSREAGSWEPWTAAPKTGP